MIVLDAAFPVMGMDALIIMQAILYATNVERKMTFTDLKVKSFVQSVSSEDLKK